MPLLVAEQVQTTMLCTCGVWMCTLGWHVLAGTPHLLRIGRLAPWPVRGVCALLPAAGLKVACCWQRAVDSSTNSGAVCQLPEQTHGAPIVALCGHHSIVS
jgi:hypothetical protein